MNISRNSTDSLLEDNYDSEMVQWGKQPCHQFNELMEKRQKKMGACYMCIKWAFMATVMSQPHDQSKNC